MQAEQNTREPSTKVINARIIISWIKTVEYVLQLHLKSLTLEMKMMKVKVLPCNQVVSLWAIPAENNLKDSISLLLGG